MFKPGQITVDALQNVKSARTHRWIVRLASNPRAIIAHGFKTRDQARARVAFLTGKIEQGKASASPRTWRPGHPGRWASRTWEVNAKPARAAMPASEMAPVEAPTPTLSRNFVKTFLRSIANLNPLNALNFRRELSVPGLA